ncbi:MAG TPA: hypothetical protein VIC02_02440, partial [Kineobactrum sp.]
AVSSLRHVLAADGSDSYITTVLKKGYIAHFPAPTIIATESPEGWRRLLPAPPALVIRLTLLALALLALWVWWSRAT